MSREERVDPLPDQFASLEEAADFWGGHDTADYPEAFEAEGVRVEADLQRRHFEVEVDADLVEELGRRAHQQGVPGHRLVSDLLRRQLSLAP